MPGTTRTVQTVLSGNRSRLPIKSQSATSTAPAPPCRMKLAHGKIGVATPLRNDQYTAPVITPYVAALTRSNDTQLGSVPRAAALEEVGAQSAAATKATAAAIAASGVKYPGSWLQVKVPYERSAHACTPSASTIMTAATMRAPAMKATLLTLTTLGCLDLNVKYPRRN